MNLVQYKQAVQKRFLHFLDHACSSYVGSGPYNASEHIFRTDPVLGAHHVSSTCLAFLRGGPGEGIPEYDMVILPCLIKPDRATGRPSGVGLTHVFASNGVARSEVFFSIPDSEVRARAMSSR